MRGWSSPPSRLRSSNGKSFKPADLRPLNDLGDGGKVTVWGDVFFTEVKGNRRKIYFTSITDYNGSINLKVLRR